MRTAVSLLIASVLIVQAREVVFAQTPPQQPREEIHFRPPPTPKPSGAIQLAAPRGASLDIAVHPVSQVVPSPKIQGPLSVQGPASASQAALPFVAAPPVRPAAAVFPF